MSPLSVVFENKEWEPYSLHIPDSRWERGEGSTPLIPPPLIPLSKGGDAGIQSRNRVDENRFPQTILWAWERPEDLEFLRKEGNRVGENVARRSVHP